MTVDNELLTRPEALCKLSLDAEERERFAKVKAAVASSDWNTLKTLLGE